MGETQCNHGSLPVKTGTVATELHSYRPLHRRRVKISLSYPTSFVDKELKARLIDFHVVSKLCQLTEGCSATGNGGRPKSFLAAENQFYRDDDYSQ